jgi:hypothetical protein
MDPLNWMEEKEKIRKEALERHEELHMLFQEDRLSFERERKRLLDEIINSAEDPEEKQRLRELQTSWDKKLRHAGSKHNRFVLAQTFFWEHFNEVWRPTLQECAEFLKGWQDRK